RHADVHQRDVGIGPLHLGDGLEPVGRLGDDLQVVLGLQDHAEAGAHELLIVRDEDAEHQLRAPSNGSSARTSNPPPARGPAESSPLKSVARSSIPRMPWPDAVATPVPAPAPAPAPRPSSTIESATACGRNRPATATLPPPAGRSQSASPPSCTRPPGAPTR